MTSAPNALAGFKAPPVQATPINSATKSESPIPTGATKVTLVFSAANMRMVNTSSIVKNISRKSPWAIEVPGASAQLKSTVSPGRRPRTAAAAAIEATTWAMNMKIDLDV